MKLTKVVAVSGKKPPAAGKGRPKGALNKTTQEAKTVIALVAAGLGGADRMLVWAKKDPRNEATFWTAIYPKLLPLTVANADGETFKTERTVRFVKAKSE